MDEAMKRVKQLVEHGQYPVEENVCPIARCPDCGRLVNVWEMSHAHVKGAPHDQRVQVCDDCYEDGDQYDSRWITIKRSPE